MAAGGSGSTDKTYNTFRFRQIYEMRLCDAKAQLSLF